MGRTGRHKSRNQNYTRVQRGEILSDGQGKDRLVLEKMCRPAGFVRLLHGASMQRGVRGFANFPGSKISRKHADPSKLEFSSTKLNTFQSQRKGAHAKREISAMVRN